MKLVGVSFAAQGGPVSNAYVALDDLTVLVGPNDSGKTQALRAVADVLDASWGDEHGQLLTTARLGHSDAWGSVFFETSWDEARSQARWWPEGVRDVATSGPGARWRVEAVASALEVSAEDTVAVIDAARAAEPKAFGDRPLVAVAATSAPVRGRYANAALCVRPETAAGRRFLRLLGDWDSPGSVRSTAPASPIEPVAVVDIGPVDLRRFRRTRIVAPLATESTDGLVGAAVQALAYELHWGPVRWYQGVLWGALSDYLPLPLEDGNDDEDWVGSVDIPALGPAALLSTKPGVARTHRDVDVAARFVAEEANALLPTFVSERYELEVHVNDPVRVGAGHPVRVIFRDRVGNAVFAPAEGPGGFRLWGELAAAEAARLAHDEANRLARVLDMAVSASDAEEAGTEPDLTGPPLARSLEGLQAFVRRLAGQGTTRGARSAPTRGLGAVARGPSDDADGHLPHRRTRAPYAPAPAASSGAMAARLSPPAWRAGDHRNALVRLRRTRARGRAAGGRPQC